MDPSRNLLILHSPGYEAHSDWVVVADKIRSLAPDIDVRLGDNTRADAELATWQVSRPSLVFSARFLNKFLPRGGKLYCGRIYSKVEQAERLEKAGVDTPRSLPLIPGLLLSKDHWGDYVIVKPLRGSHGVGISLARTGDVATRYVKLCGNDPRRSPMLVQQFIDHTDERGRLTDHRALMMFGQPLYLHRRRQRRSRRSLEDLAAALSGEIASNAPGAARTRELVYTEEILDLARKAAAAFPSHPILGIDIIQCRSTQRYYVLEVNPAGTVWHFSSNVGKKQFDEATRTASYKQFDALSTAANSSLSGPGQKRGESGSGASKPKRPRRQKVGRRITSVLSWNWLRGSDSPYAPGPWEGRRSASKAGLEGELWRQNHRPGREAGSYDGRFFRNRQSTSPNNSANPSYVLPED